MAHTNSTNLAEPTAGGEDRTHLTDLDTGAHDGKNRRWLWFAILVVLVAAGIWYYRGSRASTEAQGPGGGPGQAAAGNTKGGRGGSGFGQFVVPVVVATAQKGDLPVYFNGLGSVTAFNTVTVRTRVDGQIVKINFTEGQMVREGDSLIEIDPRPYQVQLEQAEGQLARDQAQLRDVQIDFERYQLLYKEGVIPKQQVDTQQAQVGQYEGAIKSDQGAIDNAKLQIIYCHINAPINGRIGLRLVDIGNIVHAADQNGLLVITQLQPIAVIFTLPEDQLTQVLTRMRTEKQLTVDAYDRDDTTKIASGKLLTIDNQIDPTTGTYKLKAIFANENNMLFPNQFVNTHLLVDVKHNITLVPNTAVQRGPQGSYVYVVQNGDTVKIQNVTVGLITGNLTGISSGLNAGDVVVTDGQDKLQDGSKVNTTTQPAGATNAENPNGIQQASPQQPNTLTPNPPPNINARRHGQAPQQGHSTGKGR